MNFRREKLVALNEAMGVPISRGVALTRNRQIDDEGMYRGDFGSKNYLLRSIGSANISIKHAPSDLPARRLIHFEPVTVIIRFCLLVAG